MAQTSKQTLACSCSEVEIEVVGPPILAGACYCDDCQEAGKRLEALPGAPRLLGPDGATDSVLVRNDRYSVIRGADNLAEVKLTPDTITKRVYASCCNTPLYLGFDKGPHWTTFFRDRFPEPRPKLEMRLNTKFAPVPSAIPNDVPNYKTFPLRFIAKLMAARVAMTFTR